MLMSATITLKRVVNACSGKTVEEVWNSIHKSSATNDGQHPGLPGFQTVTLGSFLERVGVDFPSMDLQQNGLLPPAPDLQVLALAIQSISSGGVIFNQACSL